MDLGTSVRTCFSKYVTFAGRAPRSEFWWFVLFYYISVIVLSIVDSMLSGAPILSFIFILAVFLPSISVMVRRLHDHDKSGWWYWITLVPLIGIVLMIYWMVSKGTEGANRFGPAAGSAPSDNNSGDFTKSAVPSVTRD